MTICTQALEIDRMFSIQIPVWDATLIVTYGSDLDFFERSFQDQPNWGRKKKQYFSKQLKEIFREEKKSAGALYMYHHTEGYHWIHVFQKHDLGTMMNHLSHEILHMVFDLLRQRGLRHSEKSEETYTYLQGYLMEQALENLFPSKTKKTTKKK